MPAPAKLVLGPVNLRLVRASWREHRRELYVGEEESDERVEIRKHCVRDQQAICIRVRKQRTCEWAEAHRRTIYAEELGRQSNAYLDRKLTSGPRGRLRANECAIDTTRVSDCCSYDSSVRMYIILENTTY